MANVDSKALGINDIIIPETINAWPPAIGWWILGLLIMALILGTVLFYNRHQKKWVYRRVALTQLSKRLNEYKQNQDSHRCIVDFMAVLKRVSLTIYAKQSGMTLEGKEFLQFANQQLDNPSFSSNTLDTIEEALYTENHTLNIHSFYQECCCWIKQHPQVLNRGDTPYV